MKLRTLTVLAALALFGCSDDSGATATTDEDTGGGIPLDTSTDETSGDETTPPADTTTGGDSPAPTDTGTPPADAPVTGTPMKCGSVTCDKTTQECCITAGIPICIARGGVCAGARYSCTSPTNCSSGQVCCTSGAGTGGASCTASASCPSSWLCDSNADCSGKLKVCKDIGSGIKACSNM